MTVSYGKGYEAKARKLWSRLIRERDGACKRPGCGATANLQAAHIITRKLSATATDMDNGIALCSKCHHEFGDNPCEFALFVFRLIGRDAYHDLYERSKARGRFDWQAEYERLLAVADEMRP